MPKVTAATSPPYDRQVYPGDLIARTDGYERARLSEAAGLETLGVGVVTLQPGGATSLFHWHEREDEMVYVLSGELTIIEGSETYTLTAGEGAAFKAGTPVPHTAENRSSAPVQFLEMGTRHPDEVCHYHGLDLVFHRNGQPARYAKRDGTPLSPGQTPDIIQETLED